MDGCADVGNVLGLRQPAVIIGAVYIDLSLLRLQAGSEARFGGPAFMSVSGCGDGRHLLGAKGNIEVAAQQFVQVLLLGFEGVAQLDELES